MKPSLPNLLLLWIFSQSIRDETRIACLLFSYTCAHKFDAFPSFFFFLPFPLDWAFATHCDHNFYNLRLFGKLSWAASVFFIIRYMKFFSHHRTQQLQHMVGCFVLFLIENFHLVTQGKHFDFSLQYLSCQCQFLMFRTVLTITRVTWPWVL